MLIIFLAMAGVLDLSPARLEAVAVLAGYFTSAKQISFMGSVALLAIGLLALVWTRVRPKA